LIHPRRARHLQHPRLLRDDRNLRRRQHEHRLRLLCRRIADGDSLGFRRASNGTITSLGTLGGNWSIPNAISADGSVIVGQSDNGSSEEAFIYQNGTMTGLGFLTGGSTSNATGVSADGSIVVGYGDVGGGAIHAFTYANQTLLDATEWMRSLNGPGSLGAMAFNLGMVPLEGAHHRPLMSYDGMGKQRQFWATGDFGASSARPIAARPTAKSAPARPTARPSSA
jgi:probable HAF family extracellular repeat protein